MRHMATLHRLRPTADAGHSLGFEIFGVVSAKLMFLGVLYFMFFAPAHPVASDAGAVSSHIVGVR